tara:strand:+ start:366 stop:1232 length:867 start_codon:yes stop_codon:yes gene_type:complete
VTSYTFVSSGTVTIGDAFLSNNFNFKPIDIRNYSSGSINNVKFSIPDNVKLSSIIVSSAIQIELVNNTLSPNGRKIIEVSAIKQNSNVRLLIPISKNSTSCCDVINSKESKLEIQTDGNVGSPYLEAFIKASIATIFFIIIILGISSFVLKSLDKFTADYEAKLEERRRELAQIIENNKEMRKRQDELDAERELLVKSVNKVRVFSQRQRLFLLKRISEYSKEIQFWRRTVEKILTKRTCSEDIDKIFIGISDKLQTQSTHSNIQKEYDDLESIIRLVEEIVDETKTK